MLDQKDADPDKYTPFEMWERLISAQRVVRNASKDRIEFLPEQRESPHINITVLWNHDTKLPRCRHM